MKPHLIPITGKVFSLEPTVNGYSIEIIDIEDKYLRCFLSTEDLSRFASQHGEIKPKMEIRIKACRDIGMYGEERLSVEYIKTHKKK